MTVLAALKDGLATLRANPSLLVAGFVVATVEQVTTVGSSLESPVAESVASLVSFLAFPFVLGGILGMALDGVRESETSLGSFVRSGRENYVRVLAGTILYVLVVVGIVFAGFLGNFVGTAGLFGLGALSGNEAVGTAAMILGAILSILGLVVFLVVVLAALVFGQFYDAAIVVEDRGVVEAFSRSVELVRANVLSVLGFTLLWGAVLSALVTPEVAVESSLGSLAAGEGLPALEVDRAIATGGRIALASVGAAYAYTVYTAYFVRLEDQADPETTADPAVDAGAAD